MDSYNQYLLIAIITLLVIALFVLIIKPASQPKKFSILAGFAFAFVIAGSFFPEKRLLGYSLMGFGLFLAIVDIIMKFTSRKMKD